MRRTAGMRWVAALVLVFALAGCKSGKSSPGSSTPTAGTATNSPAAATCVIPQNNGGDHDADNNGGPDDGDGCDK